MLFRLGLTTSKTYVHIYYARENHNILQYVVSSLIKQYAAIQLLMFAYDRLIQDKSEDDEVALRSVHLRRPNIQ